MYTEMWKLGTPEKAKIQSDLIRKYKLTQMFDIDKLYLISLSRRVKTTYKTVDGKRVPVDMVEEEFDKNKDPKLYYRNQLLNSYLALLKNHGKRTQKLTEKQSKINATLDASVSDVFSVSLSELLKKQGINTIEELTQNKNSYLTAIDKAKNREKYEEEVSEFFKNTGIDWNTERQIPVNGISESGDIHIQMRPVDNDTALIKNVLKRIEQTKPKERYYAYQFGNLAFQVMTKSAFIVGKTGISRFALHNTHQVLTQLYGVRFSKNTNGILTKLGCERLDSRTDKQGNLIQSWLSGFINANVDVAKDPYIQRLNVNEATYDVINLLIRTGMGERTLFFTAQPIMKDLARVYMNEAGVYMVDQDKSKSYRQRQALLEYVIDKYAKSKGGDIGVAQIKKLMRDDSVSEKDKLETERLVGEYAKGLFGINDDGSYSNIFMSISPVDQEGTVVEGNILEDILTNKDNLINKDGEATFDNLTDEVRYRIAIADKEGNSDFVDLSPKMAQLYIAAIYRNLEPYSSRLGDLVNVCKIDTKKHGKNFVEQQAYLEKYETVFNDDEGFFEPKGLATLKGKNGESFIHHKTMSATSLFKDVMAGFSIQSSDEFVEIHKRIIKKLNTSLENKKISRSVQNQMMIYIKKQFFDKVVQAYSNKFGYNYGNSLLYGENSVQDQLEKVKYKILHDKEARKSTARYRSGSTIKNPLLAALSQDPYTENKEFNSPKLIKFDTALLDDDVNNNAIYRAWDDLYRDKTNYIENEDGTKVTFHQFAINLMLYAFYTSGDRQGLTKFFNCVPNTLRKHEFELADGPQSYAEYMRNVVNELPSVDNYDEIGAFANEVIKQAWKDNEFVRLYRQTIRTKEGPRESFVTYGKTNRKVEVLKRVFSKKSQTWSSILHTAIKQIPVLLGALRRSDSGAKSFIDLTNDGEFPPFIKVRRKTAPRKVGQQWERPQDLMLLYEFFGTKPVDPKNPNKGVFPIYRLTVPNSASFKAGRFWYNIYLPIGADPISYDQHTLAAIDFITDENGMVQEDVTAQTELLDKIKDVLEDVGILFDDITLRQLIKDEFAAHEMPISETTKGGRNKDKLTKAVDYIQESLKNSLRDQQEQEKDAAKKKAEKQKTSSKQKKQPDERSKLHQLLDKVLDEVYSERSNSQSKSESTQTKTNERIAEKSKTIEKLTSRGLDFSGISFDPSDFFGDAESKPVDLTDEKFNDLKSTVYTPFNKDGIEFQNVYQYTQYKRIDFAKDLSEEEKEELRQKVLDNPGFAELKQIGKQYDVDKARWQSQFKEVMTTGFVAAYNDSRNQKQRDLLLGTGSSSLTARTEDMAEIYSNARDLLEPYNDEDQSGEAKDAC